MREVSTPLSGVTIDLSNLGAHVSDAVAMFWPLAAIAAGIILAGALLTRGLGFLRGAAGGRR